MTTVWRPTTLPELLDRHGELAPGRLERAARDHDVVLGELTDEELLLCGRDPDAEPDSHWTPHLHRLDAPARAVALHTTERLLVSHGLLEITPDGGAAFGPPHSLVLQLLADAVAALTWRYTAGEERGAGGAFLLPGGLALHDDIDEHNGQHGLVVRTADREAAYVAAALDAGGRCGTTGEPQVAATVEQLRPTPDELAARAVSSAAVARVARTPDGGVEQAVTSYGVAEGLWLLQGRRGPEPVATLQLVSDADLLALARALTTLG